MTSGGGLKRFAPRSFRKRIGKTREPVPQDAGPAQLPSCVARHLVAIPIAVAVPVAFALPALAAAPNRRNPPNAAVSSAVFQPFANPLMLRQTITASRQRRPVPGMLGRGWRARRLH